MALGLPYDSHGTRIARLGEALAVVKGAWGAGPFDFAGEHYSINELDSTVAVFAWNDDTGQMTETQVLSTIPGGHEGRNTTAEIAASACGRFLYVSNRGQDSIVLFRIDPATGHLTFAGYTPTGGSRPRFFALDPTGLRLYAANQDSNDIAAFQIDQSTGTLHPLGIVARTGSPSAIGFAPAP